MQRFFAVVTTVFLLAAPALADLEVYLPLDSSLADATGNGHNGSMVDGTMGTHGYTTGQVNQGLDLGSVDESYDYMTSNSMYGDYVAIDYVLPDAGAIALWYKFAPELDGAGGLDYSYQSIWDNSGTSAAPADNWECWMDKRSKLWARAADGEDDRWSDEDNRATYYRMDDYYAVEEYRDQWFHITVTWEKLDASTMEMDMYLNGEVVDTCPAMTWQDPGSTFYLGGGNDGNTYGIGAWDELAIWTNRLTADQVKNVYNDGVTAWDQVGLPGDLNDDGAVNSGDLDIVRGAWGDSVTPGCLSCGDANGDGQVNSGDLDIIRANWGRTSAAAAVIPEPATLLLVVCGCGLALLRRKPR